MSIKPICAVNSLTWSLYLPEAQAFSDKSSYSGVYLSRESLFLTELLYLSDKKERLVMEIASFIARSLKNSGVRFVFGVPGGPSIPLMEAWREEGIPFILTSHEGASGIMATVTARISSAPGVCHATFGPGAVNLASGVGAALLDRSPLIAFTTEVPDTMLARTTQMKIDHQKLFSAVTKGTWRLTPQNAAEVMTEAIKLATGEYPGPVHVGIPSDAGSIDIPSTPAGSAGRGKLSTAVRGDIKSKLKGASRPVIALGLTAARRNITHELLSLLERCPMPVVVTPMAKGVIPPSHPCFAGVLFHAFSDKVEAFAGNSDLIIGLGYDEVEFNYDSWVPPGLPIAHFNTVLSDMPDNYPVVMATGEPDSWFEILRCLPESADYMTGRDPASLINEIGELFGGMSDRWGPAMVMSRVCEAMPEGALYSCDVGSHLHMAGQMINISSPDQMMMTNGWSSMGFGLPAALAIKLNRPHSEVVAFTGDGGFLMSVGELLTARRYGLNVIVVVISDNELNLIKVKQSWRGVAPYATDIIGEDMFGSDRCLGVKVIQAICEDSLLAAIEEARGMSEPVIINARVKGDDYYRMIVRR